MDKHTIILISAGALAVICLFTMPGQLRWWMVAVLAASVGVMYQWGQAGALGAFLTLTTIVLATRALSGKKT